MVTPAIRKVVTECVERKLGIIPTLQEVLKHARHYGTVLRFEDSIEVADLYWNLKLESVQREAGNPDVR
jgi:hypothetical protein